AAGGTSAPYLYQGTYPGHCCTSVNHVVCHGIPADNHILAEGDIINVDVTPILDGFHGDTSRTFFVGEVSDTARALVETTFRALWLGIHAVGPGKHTGDIGRAIQPYVERRGYSVVREFTGHGLGRTFHTAPTIFHHATLGRGIEFLPGMAFTIEPMINLGRWKTRILADGWTAETIDKKLSAQFEHTLIITETGVDIMTLGVSEKPFTP
ncbi:MAG: type I methionyl aminopeptidase, partial [Deltaproteobacteria bacterium]|nr:type I methionyl aminopeptidase [Deltaproteobacteria bacterium]